jgi:hypothetical protein
LFGFTRKQENENNNFFLKQKVRIVGTGVTGFRGDDGPSLSAELSFPTDMSLNPDLANIFYL